MKYYFFILAACLSVLSACTTTKPLSSERWPSYLPPKEYYINYYNTHSNHSESYTLEHYLMWVERFYHGWEPFRGWLHASDELISTLKSPSEQKLARDKSFAMGKIASAEWALENSKRKINNQHLSIWGNALLDSIDRREQLLILAKMLADVKSLMDGNLLPVDINNDRYYIQTPFGDDFE